MTGNDDKTNKEGTKIKGPDGQLYEVNENDEVFEHPDDKDSASKPGTMPGQHTANIDPGQHTASIDPGQHTASIDPGQHTANISPDDDDA